MDTEIINEFNKYCTKVSFSTLVNTVNLLTARVLTLESQVTALQTSLNKINKLNELIELVVLWRNLNF